MSEFKVSFCIFLLPGVGELGFLLAQPATTFVTFYMLAIFFLGAGTPWASRSRSSAFERGILLSS
jgi:hypothetical protein